MAADRPFSVEILGIPHMEGVERPGQGIFSLGDTNKMDVIGHKAVGPDIHTVSRRVLCKPAEVALIIDFSFEYRLVVVPPLYEMVRVANDDRSGETGHY